MKTYTQDTETGQNPLNALAFGHIGVPYLFPYQHLVVSNTLEAAGLMGEEAQGRAPKRQLAILPTGSGKSLCYMLPAALLPGLTVLVFPLRSLIADQQRRAQDAQLNCVTLVGGQSQEERREIWQRLASGEVRMLLTNPEMLLSPGILDRLSGLNRREEVGSRKKMSRPRETKGLEVSEALGASECGTAHIPISHLVFDEAHTISEWGDSFRPSYLEVSRIAAELQPVVITAFTATASERIIDRVTTLLFNGVPPALIRANPDRPNITYSVIPSISKDHDLVELLSGKDLTPLPRPALVFCRSRSGAELTAAMLRRRIPGLPVRFYHAGLTKEEKADTEKWFFESGNGVLASTTAYGMGVDKKNIRAVVHREPSPSIEAYLQESGRAGRDGALSHAVTLLSPEDYSHLKLIEREDERRRYTELLNAFAEKSRCRRSSFLRLLDAEAEACFGCDVCNGRVREEAEGESILYTFFSRRPLRFTSAEAVKILGGRDAALFSRKEDFWEPCFAALSHWTTEEIEQAIDSLIKRGVLKSAGPGPWKKRIRPCLPLSVKTFFSAAGKLLSPPLPQNRKR
ncbi:MAG: helicase-related protein [Spirochaetaceae bacterium]